MMGDKAASSPQTANDEPPDFWAGWQAHGLGMPCPVNEPAARGWLDREWWWQRLVENQKKLEAMYAR